MTGPESKGETPERLERETKVKVFDNSKFVAQLQKYVNEGRMKTPEVNVKMCSKNCSEFRIGQIGHTVADGSPPLRRFVGGVAPRWAPSLITRFGVITLGQYNEH